MFTSKFRVAVAFLALISLLSIVSATRFSDFAHRKGYGPNVPIKKRQTAQSNGNSGHGHENFRFLNPSTEREYCELIVLGVEAYFKKRTKSNLSQVFRTILARCMLG